MNNKTMIFLGLLATICFSGAMLTQVSKDLTDSNYEDCLESSERTLVLCVNERVNHGRSSQPYSDDLLKSIAINNMECVKEDRLQKENCKSLVVEK